ncbi:MAG: HAMP domain-containing protein, partial [Actinobacteria bacterium]|nr:HAMP domain-containing protein [Actinomycetota bacterium]
MTPLRLQISVRTRAAVVAAVVMFVAALLDGVTLIRIVGDHLVDSDRNAAELRARDVLALATAGDLPAKLSFPGEENAATQVIDAKDRVIAGTGNIDGDAAISGLRPEPGESASHVGRIGALDDKQRYVVVAVTGEKSPHATALAATSLEATDETVATLRRALMIGLPLLVALVGTTTWFLVGRALRPVASITDEVADITGRGLSRRVPEPTTGDEIAELAVTMNGMLARLEASSERQQRFVADASHELRSPLASARTTLEVAALHPGSRDELVAAIEDALVDHDRLERLTLDLLSLAESDERRLASSVEHVDV